MEKTKLWFAEYFILGVAVGFMYFTKVVDFRYTIMLAMIVVIIVTASFVGFLAKDNINYFLLGVARNSFLMLGIILTKIVLT